MELRISLNKFACIYLALPILIFMLTWIKLVIGIPAVLLIGFALYQSIKRVKKVSISKKNLLIALGIAFIWCFLAGQGGFYYQSADHWARNAIFHDLINNSWPVVFEKQDALLNYYIGYWLVPALFGKVTLFISKNSELAWLVARIFLLAWSTISVALCFLLLTDTIVCKSRKHFLFAVCFFILFSGLDIIGIYLTNKNAGLHIEWWAGKYQYSSFTTSLFWVFNQAVPAWIATLLLLNDRRIENFAFCGLCIFISSPIPLVGLLPIYLAVGFIELFKLPSGDRYKIWGKIFSLQNIIACMVILPICLIYYSDNAAIKVFPAVNGMVKIMSDTTKTFDLNDCFFDQIKPILRFCTFYVLEVGVFLAILFRKYKKSVLFWCIAIEFAFIPFIHIGQAADFAMRASIPPLVVLMSMVLRDFIDCTESRNNIFTLYCVILAFAVMTPSKEFYRGVYEIYKNKQFVCVCDTVKTIENTIQKDKCRNNFISYDYSKSRFKKLLAR